eukprot:g57424.t1
MISVKTGKIMRTLKRSNIRFALQSEHNHPKHQVGLGKLIDEAGKISPEPDLGLIPCDDCGAMISPLDGICIHCGAGDDKLVYEA